VIGVFPVREDMHEQPAVGFEPAADIAHEAFVVFHMLEHFDRHHAIECVERIKSIHIAGDDAQIAQAAARALSLDILSLCRRVRHGGDARARVMLGEPERERAPAAAELENALSIADLGTLAC
jgi:hypothetical protein